MPPRFAAMFCMMNTKAVSFLFPHDSSTKNPRGRKVTSAMSFAMIIEPK